MLRGGSQEKTAGNRRCPDRSATRGGTDHVSHRLVSLGFSERSAVRALYLLGLIGGLTAWVLREWYSAVDPMFVVAPSHRKNRVREQLRRPTFKQLGLDRKVRFLSYEVIDEIDGFFATSESGLTVETIVGKSEVVS